MSHRVHFFHMIWGTKNRASFLLPKVQEKLFPYMNGIVRKSGGDVLALGGMQDHVHLLLGLSNLDKYTALIRNAKAGSSGWLKNQFPECRDFTWQKGFGSFSVSLSLLDVVREYILNQEAHHAKITFKDEYIKYLVAHGIEFDEKHLFD